MEGSNRYIDRKEQVVGLLKTMFNRIEFIDFTVIMLWVVGFTAIFEMPNLYLLGFTLMEIGGGKG